MAAKTFSAQGGFLKFVEVGVVTKYYNFNKLQIGIDGDEVTFPDGNGYAYNDDDLTNSFASVEAFADQVGTWKKEAQAGSGGGGAVDSVFGRTGAVVAQSGDYRIDQITNSEYSQSTGVVYGGLLSVNGVDNTKFDISQGAFLIIDNSDLQNVKTDFITLLGNETGLTLGNLATQPRTNVAISLTNTPRPNIIYTNSFTALVGGVNQTVYVAEKSVADFDAEERRVMAVLGRFSHSNNVNILFEINLQQVIASPLGSFIDFIKLFPAINVEGNNFSGKAGVLQVAKTEGKGFRFGSNYALDSNNPNIQDIPAADPTSHAYRYQNGSGGFTQTSFSNLIDPENWDDGTGTLNSVAPNRWTLQPVWVFAGSGSMFIQYGQEEFASKEAAIEALASINPVLDDNLTNDAVFRGWFIVVQGATDLSDPNEFEWRAPLSERGSGQGTTVVQDLQTVYKASIDPEITTDAIRGAHTVQGGTGNDSDLVYEGKNNAGVVTFSVAADGTITGNGSGITGVGSEAYTTVTPATDFGNAPAGFETAAYSKDSNTLYLTGVVERTGAGATPTDLVLFNLPVGHRPSNEQLIWGSMGASPAVQNGSSIIRVKVNGDVTLTNVNFLNTNDTVRLNGVIKL